MNALTHPNLLLVNHYPANLDTATGITLTNLFQDWPKPSIGELYISNPSNHLSLDVNSHQLPRHTFPADSAKGLARRIGLQKDSAIKRGENAAIPREPSSATSAQRLTSSLSALADLGPTFLSQETKGWLSDLSPQVIYSALGNVRTMTLCVSLSRHLDIPIVPHFLDDWPDTLYSSGELCGIARSASRRRLKAVMDRSSRGLAISPQMSSEFEHRYGIPFTDVMNCTKRVSPPDPLGAQPSYVLAYIGGLHLGRDVALRQCLAQLERARASGAKLVVRIFSPSGNEASALHREFPSLVRYLGQIPEDEVAKEMRAADMLIHVESLDPRHRAFTRLSISTKIPQYLASGRPVLAFGPPEVASMTHLSRSGGAICFSDGDIDTMARVVTHTLRDVSALARLSANGRTFAQRFHSAERVRSKLLDATALSAAEFTYRRKS